jgi:hypothetical protein
MIKYAELIVVTAIISLVSITLLYVLPAIAMTVRALSPAQQRGREEWTDTSSTCSRATAQP